MVVTVASPNSPPKRAVIRGDIASPTPEPTSLDRLSIGRSLPTQRDVGGGAIEERGDEGPSASPGNSDCVRRGPGSSRERSGSLGAGSASGMRDSSTRLRALISALSRGGATSLRAELRPPGRTLAGGGVGLFGGPLSGPLSGGPLSGGVRLAGGGVLARAESGAGVGTSAATRRLYQRPINVATERKPPKLGPSSIFRDSSAPDQGSLPALARVFSEARRNLVRSSTFG